MYKFDGIINMNKTNINRGFLLPQNIVNHTINDKDIKQPNKIVIRLTLEIEYVYDND